MADTYRILSVDGGGVRGLIPAIWLHHLERQLGNPLHEHFNVIAGTSTGSFIAAALAAGMDTEACVDMYRSHADAVFPASGRRFWETAKRIFTARPTGPRYDGEGLEKVLREVFGDMLFGELKVPT